ncbi:rspo3 [Pungitius sinensis]
MRMPPFIWILHFMHLTGGQDGARRSASVGRHCPAGCATCSASNGCLSCKPRLFFHLELDGMRQRGTCVSSCPRGHYGARSPHISTCARCKDDCSSCFSESFCTHCHPGHFLHRGKCENRCPDGLTANAVLRECTECSAGCEVCVRGVCVKCRADADLLDGQCHLACPAGFEPDLQLMHCIPQVLGGSPEK